jgi:glyoxylate reductase
LQSQGFAVHAVAMARIVITAPLPEGQPSWRSWLVDHQLREPESQPWSRARWLTEIAEAEALVCLLGDRIDRQVFDAGPRLRVVANYAVGYDNVDVGLAADRGVVVTNTPDVLTDATADFTWALILATARRLGEAERYVRAGQWDGFRPTLLLGTELRGQTLGLIGYGRIGRAVAQRARGFGMRVVTADTRGRQRGDADAIATDLAELLATADVVSLHCPLTPDTRGIIDRSALARMKPGAILINTARGACIDDDAVAAALESGHLGGAGLDVFTAEPQIAPRLAAAPHTVLAPHVGSATTKTRVRMAELCMSAVQDVLAGRTPPNQVRL